MDRNLYYGEVLRAVRAWRKLSCPEIANRNNMSTTTIYNYEAGKCRPKQKNSALLFRALNIKVEVFDRLVDEAIADGCRVSPTELAQRIVEESERSKVIKTERIEMTAQPLSAEGVIIAAINGELEGLSLGELREVLRNILNMKRGNEIRKEVKYGNDHSQRGSNAPPDSSRYNPSSDT